jgi:hypothetical protein
LFTPILIRLQEVPADQGTPEGQECLMDSTYLLLAYLLKNPGWAHSKLRNTNGKLPRFHSDPLSAARADAILQQTIINLIDVRNIIDSFPLIILVVQANFIVKDRVEANVFKSSCVVDGTEVAAIAAA